MMEKVEKNLKTWLVFQIFYVCIMIEIDLETMF